MGVCDFNMRRPRHAGSINALGTIRIGTVITDPSVTEQQSGNAATVIGGGQVLEVNTPTIPVK